MTTTKPDTTYKTVHIYDQTYHLSGPDLAAVERLASLVDSRMRLVASRGRTADSLRVAVLAALNLADELTRTREQLQKLEAMQGGADPADVLASAEIRARAASLNGLLDQILEEEHVPGS